MTMITKAQVNPMCADLDKLPTFTFRMGGQSIPFYPKDYAKKVRVLPCVCRLWLWPYPCSHR
jgi:hypothetical protein